MKYDNTVICLSDLLKFLDEEVGLEVEWLRKFAERWRRYCALPATKVDGARKFKLKSRATYDVEEITRRYSSERAGLDPFPTEVADREWFETEYPGLPRSIWRDKIRADLAPDEAKKQGPRGKRNIAI